MKHLKSSTACIITLGMLAGAPLAQAAEQSTTGSGMETTTPGSGAMQRAPGSLPDLSTSYRSDKIIGMDVKNSAGEELGEISQIILDSNGQATHVVLSAGGVLGVAAEDYIVPWNKVQLSRGDEHAVIDVQKDAISSEFSAFEVEEESAPLMRRDESDRMGTGTGR
jgi:sporulation protein YlmC with PRC-barrel domain